MRKIRIGYAPTRRFVFSKEDAFRYKNIIREKMESFGLDMEIVDLEGINEEGLLYDDEASAREAVRRFRERDVDALFVPHCNFGTEDIVARTAKAVGKPRVVVGPQGRGAAGKRHAPAGYPMRTVRHGQGVEKIQRSLYLCHQLSGGRSRF